MRKIIFALSCILACARLAAGTPIVLYSNLAVTNGMAAASRPETPGTGMEIEAADDFILVRRRRRAVHRVQVHRSFSPPASTA